jgi:DNA-binding NarL/FixJ family response regulator
MSSFSALGGPATVLVVAAQPLYREALVLALTELAGHTEIVVADAVESALRARPPRNPLSLVLLDANLPATDGVRALGLLAHSHPGVPVLLLGASERPDDARRALQAGAAGYVPKSAPTRTLIDAVRQVLGGGVYTPPLLAAAADPHASGGAKGLSARQLAVLLRLGEGKSNKDIARDLAMAEKTVKVHIGAIFKRLGVANRTQAVLEARRLGLLAES